MTALNRSDFASEDDYAEAINAVDQTIPPGYVVVEFADLNLGKTHELLRSAYSEDELRGTAYSWCFLCPVFTRKLERAGGDVAYLFSCSPCSADKANPESAFKHEQIPGVWMPVKAAMLIRMNS